MFFLSFFNIFAFLRFCDNYYFLFLRVKCMDLDLKKRKKKKEIGVFTWLGILDLVSLNYAKANMGGLK